MTLDADYLRYDKRRYGMDHDRYAWSILDRRPPVTWPGAARLALMIVPVIEWFPLDMANTPFAPPGAMSTSYPDLRHYTLRDYGNRVGIYRLIETLRSRGLRATSAINSAVAKRYPALVQAVLRADWEVMGHGIDMDHLHHGQLDSDAETSMVAEPLASLRQATGQSLTGWLSPAKSQSWSTLDILQRNGIEYCCDWDNDDLPYFMKAGTDRLISMPASADIDDFSILIKNHHTEDDFTDQLIDQFECLYQEAETGGGRIMSISLRPWVIGQPYRIGALERALDHILSRQGVWNATGSEIAAAWLQCTTGNNR